MGLFGRRLSNDERRAAFKYYEAAVRVTAFQEREGDRYNSALMSHMNSLDDPASAETMVAASSRLKDSSRELRRRHGQLHSLPDIDLVTRDYAAWGLLYMKYEAWAQAQADAFVALAAGREPVTSRVAQLMADAEASRKEAEKASERLLSAMGIGASDIRRLHQVAYEASELDDWESPAGSGDETSAEDLGIVGRDVSFDLIAGIAVPALDLLPMSRIEGGDVIAFDPTLPYGLLKVLVLPGQAERSGTASIAITHRDDYRALVWALEEAELPDGIGVWVTYSPDSDHPELACIGIALMNEDDDGDDSFRILKEPQQRLDL